MNDRKVPVDGYSLAPFSGVRDTLLLFSRIGIDGKRYEEYFIIDYQSDVLGLYDHLGEYESLDEFNFLARLLKKRPRRRWRHWRRSWTSGSTRGASKI